MDKAGETMGGIRCCGFLLSTQCDVDARKQQFQLTPRQFSHAP
jgi:hypothetical protein